eukprot:SAG11_NODE_25317_length_360_cov_0.996169_1_plen_48_part_01
MRQRRMSLASAQETADIVLNPRLARNRHTRIKHASSGSYLLGFLASHI